MGKRTGKKESCGYKHQINIPKTLQKHLLNVFTTSENILAVITKHVFSAKHYQGQNDRSGFKITPRQFIHNLLTPSILLRSRERVDCAYPCAYVTQFCPQTLLFAFNARGVCVCAKASVCCARYTLWALSK